MFSDKTGVVRFMYAPEPQNNVGLKRDVTGKYYESLGKSIGPEREHPQVFIRMGSDSRLRPW